VSRRTAAWRSFLADKKGILFRRKAAKSFYQLGCGPFWMASAKFVKVFCFFSSEKKTFSSFLGIGVS
jgi:hypothetical protein